jgi:hypothetical protein
LVFVLPPRGVVGFGITADDKVGAFIPAPLHQLLYPRVGGGSASSNGMYADPITISLGPPLFGAVILNAVRSL